MKLKWWHGVLLIALCLAILAPLASSAPDGLERVAEDKGFIQRALGPVFKIIPDYLMPGIKDEAWATTLSGIIGILILFGIGYGLAKLLRGRRET